MFLSEREDPFLDSPLISIIKEQDLEQVVMIAAATYQIYHLQVACDHHFLHPFLISFLPACNIYQHSDLERTSDFDEPPSVDDQDAIWIAVFSYFREDLLIVHRGTIGIDPF